MNTFMQSHSHTLIMNLGWGIREHSSVHRCSNAAYNFIVQLIIFNYIKYHTTFSLQHAGMG